jgi:tetratricopeptide (TPR) repeat protein
MSLSKLVGGVVATDAGATPTAPTSWRVPAIAAAVGTSALLGVALYMKYGRSSGGGGGDKKNNSNGEVKSGGTVKSLKDKGNAMFKEGKYAQALELYSKAVEAATEENDPSLEQLFQNRAAVFEKLVRENFNPVLIIGKLAS